MRAKLIYDASIYTSAEGVFDDVKQNLTKYEKHIIITPERMTAISEKQLLKVLNKQCCFECEVISINRLCSRVFGIGEVLNQQGGIILVQKILQEQKSNLKYFKQMQSRLGFAQNLYQTIMQFKSSGVKPEDVYTKSEDNLLNFKLQDIALVYTEYEKYINNGFTDGVYKLEQLRKEIKINSFFNNTAFYFAYFESFTYQEFQFISTLIKNNNYCVVGARYNVGAPNDYIFTNEVYSQVEALFCELGINNSNIVPYNKILPVEFEFIKNNLFAFSHEQKITTSGNIQLFVAKDETKEIKNVLKQIYYLVHKVGYRYKDINIATSNIEKYKPIIEREAQNYNFHIYYDSAVTLLNTELGRFVKLCLEIEHYHFMSSDIFLLCNNYYFGLNEEEKNFLNLFLSRYTLQGYSWLINFALIEEDKSIQKIVQALNVDYKAILEKVHNKLNFISNCIKSCKNSTEYVGAVKTILENFKVEEKTNELIQNEKMNLNSKKVLEQVVEKLNNILDQIVTLEVNVQINALEFSQIIKTGLDACKINLIPLSLDAIYVGDSSQSTFEKKPIMFLVGTNKGVNPQIKEDVGLISDAEIENLSSKYALEPKVSDINSRNKLKAYELSILPTSKLFCYYASGGDGGEEQKPSTLFTSLKNLFLLNKETPIIVQDCEKSLSSISDAEKDEFLKWVGSSKQAENQILENLEFTNSPRVASLYSSIKTQTNIEQLIKQTNSKPSKQLLPNLKDYCFKPNVNGGYNLSYSQISDYLNCPYKHFINRAIKPTILEDISINNLDVGNILHRCAELFILDVIKNKKPFNNEEIKNETSFLIQAVRGEFKHSFGVDKNKVLSKSIEKEIKSFILILNKNLKLGKFFPYKCEYEFSNYKLPAPYSKYHLIGKIDRIDKFDNAYIILDYKTGDAKMDVSKLYYGAKIQPFLYANVFRNLQKNSLIFGTAYYPIKNKFRKAEDETDFKINGFFIKDENWINALDNYFENNQEYSSAVYNIKKKYAKTDNKTSYSNNVIDATEFYILMEYAEKILKQALKEIEKGVIDVKPIKDGSLKCSCDYCEFKSICNKELYSQNRVQTTKKLEYIMEAVKKDGTI